MSFLVRFTQNLQPKNIMNYLKIRISLFFVLLIIFVQAKQDSLNYQIDLSKAKENTFVVKLNYKSNHIVTGKQIGRAHV